MATKRKPIPKRERELAALRQRIADIYSGVLQCDVNAELNDDTPTLMRTAEEWEQIIRSLQWTLGKQLQDREMPKGCDWSDAFRATWLSKFGNPEMAAEHLYAWGIRA